MYVLERGVLGVLGWWRDKGNQWEMGLPPRQLCCTDGFSFSPKLMYV
jgi:hypothetical protein